MSLEMSLFSVLIIGIFLPLFPLSFGLNALVRNIRSPFLKIAVVVSWPLIGLALFTQLGLKIEASLIPWILSWSVFTSILYAYRLLAQRGINTWTGFLATSIWSLFWIPLLVLNLTNEAYLIYMLSFAVPLSIIYLLANVFKQRFGIAYTNLHGGVATTMPRFSVLLVITVFSAIATPVFPSFFIMVNMISAVLSEASPLIAITLLLIWLIWSWAGIRIIQGLLVGSADQQQDVNDLHNVASWAIRIILVVLVFSGLFITGGFI